MVTAVTVILSVITPTPEGGLNELSGDESAGERIKGASPQLLGGPAVGPLHLKFALVHQAAGNSSEDKVIPGYDGMAIGVGETLVFAVEPTHPLEDSTVSLEYQQITAQGDAEPRVLVKDYPLSSDTAFIKTTDGVLAFTSDQVGTYVFQVKQKTTQGTKEYAGFQIQVVENQP